MCIVVSAKIGFDIESFLLLVIFFRFFIIP